MNSVSSWRNANLVVTIKTRDKAMCMQLTEEDELRWDDGTANAEYCLDQFNLVGRVKR